MAPTAIGLLLVLPLAIILYRLLLHPLARVPGPSIAAISNVWLAYHVRNGHILRLGQTLHRRYGPAVRVGPNEVWFDSREAFKAIYSAGSGYEKADFYLALMLHRPSVDWRLRLTPVDTLDLLSERDMQRYRLQRRILGPTYLASSLRKHQPAIDAAVARAVATIRQLDGAEVDLEEWIHMIVLECLGAAVLSWSPGYLKRGNDGGLGALTYTAWRRKSILALFPAAAKLSVLSRRFRTAFTALWGVGYRFPRGFGTFYTAVQKKVGRRVGAALGLKAAARNRAGPPADLLDELIDLHKSRPDVFTETYMRRMAITNFGAGHETLTSALTSIMAMVGTHPDVQARIWRELLQADDDDGLPPYTMASAREAQRLFPAIGMSLSRTVPPGPGLELHGYRFPPGTGVGCVPVALHRNGEIFGPDPDRFDPDRWLGDDHDRIRAMERLNLTWGGGARTCPGRHLADLIMSRVVPALLREFVVDVVSMPADEEIRYYFVAMLTAVRVRFVPRGGLRMRPVANAAAADRPAGAGSPETAVP